MKRRWIVLILIPIAAIVTVFAWSIAPIYAIAAVIAVLVLGIVLMIFTTRLQASSQEMGRNNYSVPSQANDSQAKERKKEEAKTSTGLPLPPTPPIRIESPEPQKSESVSGEEWDEVVEVEEWEEEEEFLAEDLDDEIKLKVQAPPPVSAMEASLGSSDKGDEDSSVRYSGGVAPQEPSIEDLEDAVIDENKKDSKEEVKNAHSVSSKTTEAQFTAYYARQTIAETEYGFYVYAHLPEALISADIEQFREQLGGRVPKPVQEEQTAELAQGAILTAMVECDALEFIQIGIMKKWQMPFVRFDFRYTAPESLVDEFVEGRIAIMLGMVEIASIDFQTLITAPQWDIQFDPTPHDPMSQTAFEPSEAARMYQKIFISYSRKDTVIAERKSVV